jgi:PhnB protein
MAVKPVPEGFHSITPYLTVDDAETLISFLQRAFEGQITYRMNDEQGKIRHAEAKIGDSMLMIGQARDEWKSRPGMFVVYVPDCDAVYKKAIDAGATVVRAVDTQPYGDRSGGVEDSQGNQWWISTHVEDVSPEEMERRMKASGH